MVNIQTMSNFLSFDPNFGVFGFNRLLGTNGPDSITVFPDQVNGVTNGIWLLEGNDLIFGSEINELILGNQGTDTILGGGAADTILGGRDNDDIYGEEGDDFLRGDLDNDFIDGGPGNDSIFGGQGNDLLVGGDGDDFLSGDRGADTLVGSEGFDTFVVNPAHASFNDFNAVDVIVDFNQQEDLIGVAGGGTLLDPNSFSQSFLDFNGDGLNDTVLRLQNGDILAIILENENITRDFNESDFIPIF